jgi:ATP-binding protein involved in chromosome partitioning
VPEVALKNKHVTVVLNLGFHLSDVGKQVYYEHMQRFLSDYDPELVVQNISIKPHVASHKTQPNQKPKKGVKNIIAVASGKGGVGKSTVAANIAVALANQGAVAGLLDADIYGPSQPQIMGSYDNPYSRDEKTLEPLHLHGVQMISLGNLVSINNAMVWRGPMVSHALMQLLNDTQWAHVDYLIVDLPPGTGDIQLTMTKKIPVTGAVVVTTPQDLSMLDARRAIKMFHKVNVDVVGVIENMSAYQCPECGHESHIFGEHGGDKLAEEQNIKMLGALPLSHDIRQASDDGRPVASNAPPRRSGMVYHKIPRRMPAYVAL